MACPVRLITGLVTGVALWGLGILPSPTRADAPPLESSAKPQQSVAPSLQTEGDDQTASPDEQTSESDADEEPIETLTAPLTEQTESDESPLERAVEGMRSAHQRIAAEDTGSETRDIQQSVVDELDKLIEMARQQQLRPNPTPQQNRPRPQQNQQQQQRQQRGQQTQSQDAARSGTGQPQGGQQSKKNPENSEQRAGTSEDREIELLPRRALLNEVWGHLPDRLRQKLLNVESDQYLPQYDTLIRRYFEALAEQDQPDRTD